MVNDSDRTEFGDFQTPRTLASQVCVLLKELRISPAAILEPTCGIGNFLLEAVEEFPECALGIGLEINKTYVDECRKKTQRLETSISIEIHHQNFFEVDWKKFIQHLPEPLLVIGNPPWVTNSALSALDSTNLPPKANVDSQKGLDALTGKSNFDICEYMLRKLAENLDGKNAVLAMLCKTSVARRFLFSAWKEGVAVQAPEIFRVDAKAEFNAAVDACLLICQFNAQAKKPKIEASVYPDLCRTLDSKQVIGLRDGTFVADMTRHDRWGHLIGEMTYQWRSGLKHDCSRVMELRCEDGVFINGFEQVVEIEDDYVFPCAKATDLKNGRFEKPRKWMIVTQQQIGDETQTIRLKAPKTWDYLCQHSNLLDARRSSIYRNRPQFSVFGVGKYSFSPWKVAISGLHKSLNFSVIPPLNGKPVIPDDTCYFIPCDHESEAMFLAELLNSHPSQEFLRSFVFWDSKRPVTIETLKKLDMLQIATELDVREKFFSLVSSWSGLVGTSQLKLFQ